MLFFLRTICLKFSIYNIFCIFSAKTLKNKEFYAIINICIN
nr:MAG TPA: hypothetical protein [Caudoviricetes sp.]